MYMSVIEDSTDRIEFERIYMQYRKQMYYLAKSMIKDACDAEDIVHDVFIVLATKHMATVREMQSENDLRNYLLKATKNTCLNFLQRKEYERKILNEEKRNIMEQSVGDEAFLETICAKMEAKEIIRAVGLLPESYREVLYYRYVEELLPAEIAKGLDRKLTTVKKQLQRGKSMVLEIVNEVKGAEINDKT